MIGAVLRRSLQALSARRSVILGYHGVGTLHPSDDPHNLLVPVARFRSQLELLLGAGFRFVTVAELARRLDGGPPPAGLAALSFDDGMQDNHSVLLPLLREFGVPATIYVTTGLVGRRNPWLSETSGARMLTGEELRELAAAGFELGAHTVTHPDLSTMSKKDCLREMVESREALERLTGAPVTTFAYPFCRYGEAARQAAAEAGFLAAVTCEGRGDWSPFQLKRAMLTGRDGLTSFLLKLADAYQPLFEAPAGRAVRAGTRAARARLRARRQPRD